VLAGVSSPSLKDKHPAPIPPLYTIYTRTVVLAGVSSLSLNDTHPAPIPPLYTIYTLTVVLAGVSSPSLKEPANAFKPCWMSWSKLQGAKASKFFSKYVLAACG